MNLQIVYPTIPMQIASMEDLLERTSQTALPKNHHYKEDLHLQVT